MYSRVMQVFAASMLRLIRTNARTLARAQHRAEAEFVSIRLLVRTAEL